MPPIPLCPKMIALPQPLHSGCAEGNKCNEQQSFLLQKPLASIRLSGQLKSQPSRLFTCMAKYCCSTNLACVCLLLMEWLACIARQNANPIRNVSAPGSAVPGKQERHRKRRPCGPLHSICCCDLSVQILQHARKVGPCQLATQHRVVYHFMSLDFSSDCTCNDRQQCSSIRTWPIVSQISAAASQE